MTDHPDLFGHSDPQGSLFGNSDDRLAAPLQDFTPKPEKVRARLVKLLTKAKEADTMPWNEREARMWQTVFPNMANWLPEDEADQLRFEFAEHMKRLSNVA